MAIFLAQGLCPPAGAAGSGAEAGLEELWENGEKALADGDAAAARKLFRAALELDRSRARSWNYLGGAYFRDGGYEDALLHFKQAFLLDPRDVRACNNIGTAYDRLGRYGKAESFYLRAIEIDGRYPLPYLNLGVLYADQLQRPADARRFWTEFLGLVPDDPEAEAVRDRLKEFGGRAGEGPPGVQEGGSPP